MPPVDPTPAVQATPSLRLMVLEYLADLPSPPAVQSLLVMQDVLVALGLGQAQREQLLGAAAADCIATLADAYSLHVEPAGYILCQARQHPGG